MFLVKSHPDVLLVSSMALQGVTHTDSTQVLTPCGINLSARKPNKFSKAIAFDMKKSMIETGQ